MTSIKLERRPGSQVLEKKKNIVEVEGKTGSRRRKEDLRRVRLGRGRVKEARDRSGRHDGRWNGEQGRRWAGHEGDTTTPLSP